MRESRGRTNRAAASVRHIRKALYPKVGPVEFRNVLTRRRSVRTYADRPVAPEVLERIAKAAVVWAPSAGFSQGLRIIVVTNPDTRRRIAVAAKEDELAAQGRPRWKAAAPVHMVVLTREDDYHDRYRQQDKLKITGGREIDWPAPYWYVDAGAAVMTLMLAAIDEGLDTAIFGVTDVQSLRETLRLPDDVQFVVVVTMGHPVERVDEPTKEVSMFTRRRRPRTEVVRWERWDGPQSTMAS
jgi:FMN reductase [NAD(P)H]